MSKTQSRSLYTTAMIALMIRSATMKTRPNDASVTRFALFAINKTLIVAMKLCSNAGAQIQKFNENYGILNNGLKALVAMLVSTTIFQLVSQPGCAFNTIAGRN